MSIRISSAEILQTSLKALEGHGVAHGLDFDGATNVTWLATRGLAGISVLVAELQDTEPGAEWIEPYIEDDDDVATIISKRSSGLLLAPGATDWALNGQDVRIPDCHAPLLFVAEAARRSVEGIGFRIEWHAGSARNNARCGHGEAALSLDLRTVNDASTVTIKLARPPKAKDLARLAAFQTKSLRDGITVDPHDWDALKVAARRVLVPTSDRSRGGAGADVDDSA